MINQHFRPTILVLTSTFPRWCGDTTPAFVFELTKKFQDLYDVVVLAPHTKNAKTREVIEGVNIIRFHYFFECGETLAYGDGIMSNLKKNPFNSLLIPFFLLSQLIAILKINKQMNIDIIHAHWLAPQGMMAAIARMFLKRKPALVCTIHGSDLKLPVLIFNPIYKFVFRVARAVVVVSRSLEQRALRRGVQPEKLTVIPMGVDIDKQFTVKEEVSNKQNSLLFVGRLVKNKGLDILLHALVEVVKAFQDASLVVVGEGSEKSGLQALVSRLHLDDHVEFVGAQTHQSLPSFYQAATVFVSPTLAEGFGLTLAEALACGCPVIVSSLPEITDMIVHEKTGLTFKVGDSRALADSIITLLKYPSLRHMLAEAGREKIISMVGWDHVVSQYASIFDHVYTKESLT